MNHLSNYLLAEELAQLSENDFNDTSVIVGQSDRYLSWNEQQSDQKEKGRACSNKVLATNISRFASNQIVNGARPKGDPVSYLELLMEVLGSVNNGSFNQPSFAHVWPQRARNLISIDEYPHEALRHCFQAIYEEVILAEEAILACVAKNLYDRLSPEQKKSFDLKVQEMAQSSQSLPIGSISAIGGLILLGNLGGFGTYIVMSSLLSTISLGTLSFGAYTAASSILSFLLGPLGWAALGAIAVHTLGKPDVNKLASVVITIAMARRQRPQANLDYEKLASHIASKLEPDYAPQKIGIGLIDSFITGCSDSKRRRAIEMGIAAASGRSHS